MADLKTKATTQDPRDFLKTVGPVSRREDSLQLLAMFEQATGQQAVMWGSSIIGFGVYHYKSERSAQEGDWPLVGFSPRKQSLTLYVITDDDNQKSLLANLGKFRSSVGCLYINKLADVDQEVLAAIIKTAFVYQKNTVGRA